MRRAQVMPEPIAEPHVALNNARNLTRSRPMDEQIQAYFAKAFRNIGRRDISDSLTLERNGDEVIVGFLKCRRTFSSLRPTVEAFAFLDKVFKHKSPKSYCPTCKRPN